MPRFANRVRFSTATTGTGTITVGSAIEGFKAPISDPGIADDDIVSYFIVDGAAWEYGSGVIGGTRTTIARTLRESSTGSLLSLSGTAEVFFAPGDEEVLEPVLFRTLASNTAFTNGNSDQPWFPDGGVLTVEADSTYQFEGLLLITSGTTTHTTGLNFGGTATLTNINYIAESSSVAVNAVGVAGTRTHINQAANTTINATSAAAGTVIKVEGVVRINAAGTFIPQFRFSAAPGAGNVLANTFFNMRRIGRGAVVSYGSWT